MSKHPVEPKPKISEKNPPKPKMPSDYRETLERLASRLESDGMGGDMADASAIREALAELADCERDHPPEEEYLAWCRAGKPDGAEVERLKAQVEFHGAKATEFATKIEAALALIADLAPHAEIEQALTGGREK